MEKYAQAKALKQSEDQLKALGVQLAKLEAQKRAAVQASVCCHRPPLLAECCAGSDASRVVLLAVCTASSG